jgi:hypothetical protein
MQSSDLDGGRELEIVRQKDPFLGSLIQRTISGINRLAKNVGAGVIGEAPAPPPIDSTEVKGTLAGNVLTAPGEILHFVHTHNAPLERGVQYINEIDTDPHFPNPHPIDSGSSRSGFVHLPTMDDSNQPVGYYLRTTVQRHGSAPSKPVVYGGVDGPTKILMGGSTSMSLLQSQSGGTAKPFQGGQGLGAVQSRGPVGGPKRNLT